MPLGAASVPLTPEEQATLLNQAKIQGVSVDSLLRQAVLRIISAAPQVNSEPLSAEQWEKEFGEWLDSLPSPPAYQTKQSAGKASTLAKTSGGRCWAHAFHSDYPELLFVRRNRLS